MKNPKSDPEDSLLISLIKPTVGLETAHFVKIWDSFVVVQLLSHVQLFATPWTAAHQASLPFTISQSLLKLMSIEWVMPPNHLILCRPLLLLPLIFPSIRIFSNESVLHIRWQNIGVSASASVLPMNIQDWFPLGLTGWIFLQSKGLSKNLPSYKGSCDCLEPIWVI